MLASTVGINIQKRGLSFKVMEGLPSIFQFCSLMFHNGFYIPWFQKKDCSSPGCWFWQRICLPFTWCLSRLVCSHVGKRLQPGSRMIQNWSSGKTRLKAISSSPRLIFPSTVMSSISDVFLPGMFAPTCTGTNTCSVMLSDLGGGLHENCNSMFVFKGCSRRPHSHCLLVQKGF